MGFRLWGVGFGTNSNWPSETQKGNKGSRVNASIPKGTRYVGSQRILSINHSTPCRNRERKPTVTKEAHDNGTRTCLLPASRRLCLNSTGQFSNLDYKYYRFSDLQLQVFHFPATLHVQRHHVSVQEVFCSPLTLSPFSPQTALPMCTSCLPGTIGSRTVWVV